MDSLDISLILSITLCSLVSGFIFSYAIVVMPGLADLNDKDFLRAFQATDAVIQKNQPMFMFTWVGSIVSLVCTIFVSVTSLGLSEAWLVVLLSVIYLLGVHGITIVVHLPLNNRIQQVVIGAFSDEAIKNERVKFEKKWNVFNSIRTSISVSVTLLLLILLTLR